MEGTIAVDVVLQRVTGSGKAEAVPVAKPAFVLGRGTDCDLRVAVADVSRRHCAVSVEDHSVLVQDLGSSNGTFVNGDRVSQARLSPGDVLTVANVCFVLIVDGEPGEFDAAAKFAVGQPADSDDSAADAPVGSGGGGGGGLGEPLLGGGGGGDPDSSSVAEFDFDFDDDDDDDDQPPL